VPRLRFLHADAGQPRQFSEAFSVPVDLLVTNPPWDRSVGAAGSLADRFDPFWHRLPRLLGPRGRLCTIADAELDVPGYLLRAGYSITLAQAVRVAGRVSHLVLATPPQLPPVRLSGAHALWRERAIEAGIVSASGF
jgi:hypothetical protein